MNRVLMAVFAAVATVAMSAPVGAGELRLSSIAVGTGISDRQLVGEGTSFPAEVGQLTCLTRVEGASADTIVTQVWRRDGQEARRIELAVRSPSWRTWSQKNVTPGQWTVAVLDPSGAEISSISFSVGPFPG